MAGHHGLPPQQPDDRVVLSVEDGIFKPDHNKVIRFITAQILLQTCDEGHCWKNVTEAQRQWYWDEFVKKYTWPEELNDTIRKLWYKNVATQYRRTVHSWRRDDRHPPSVTPGRWAAWTAAWTQEAWLAKAAKNRENRNSEPAGVGTGTTKHIAGSRTYSAHSHSIRDRTGRDPTSWELYVHTHQHDDGSFVDERSRLVHQSMEAYMAESLIPQDDGTIPDAPSPEEVNSMFKHVVGGPKKGRMYGCGSMASTMYPDDMAPRKRGGPSSSSRRGSDQETSRLREEWQAQRKVNELLRIDLQTTQTDLHMTQTDLQATRTDLQLTREENSDLKGRMSTLEEQVRMLISGSTQWQIPPTQSHTNTSGRRLYGRGSSHRGRSAAGTSRSHDPFADAKSRGKGKVLQRFSQEFVPPSQDYGYEDEDDEGADDGDGDDDETESP